MAGVRLDGVQTCPVARRRPAAGAVLAGLLLGFMMPAMPALAVERSGNWTFDSGLAAPLPALAPPPAGPSPRAARPPQVSPPARLAVAGDLPGPGSPRGLGLPAVLAAVLVLGVASLLVRVLLAEPAARRRAADPF